MSSPLNRRQLVDGGINVGLISAAGTTPNLVGEAISGIGAALGEAYEKAMGKKNAIDQESQEQELKEAGKVPGELDKKVKEQFSEPGEGQEKLQNTIQENIEGLIGDTGTSWSTLQDRISITDPRGGGRLATYDEAWASNLEGVQQKYPNKAAYIKDKTTKGKETEARRAWAEKNLPPNVTYNEQLHGQMYKDSIGANTMAQRKKDSPIERRRLGRQSSLANVFSGAPASTSMLVGNTEVPSDAISRGDVSQFTPGRTFIEKERRLSAPAWMGVGAAAVEGYNLGVEKRNYKKQVQADLQDYYAQEFAGLEAPETGVDYVDQSIQEVMLNARKEYADHLQQREKAFAEGNGAMWTAKAGDLRKMPTTVKQVVDKLKNTTAAFQEGLQNDSFDFEAMSDEQIDELMSIVKGGAPIGIGNVEGVGLSFLGSTRGGMPYLKSLNAFLGAGGPQAIEKKNAFDYVSEVVEGFRKNQDKYSKTVIDPVTKRKITVPMSMQEIKPYLMRMFDAELDSESVTRAYSSRTNWDEDGMTPEAFDASVKNGKDPKDFVKSKFYEVAQQLLSPYLGQYEETTTPESGAQFKAGLKQVEETRSKSQKEGLIDYMLSPEAFTFVPDEIVKGQTAIPELTTKAVEDFPGVKLFKGSAEVKDVDYNPQSGIMTIKPISSVRVSDGKTSVSTKEPITVDFNQNPDNLRLILSNLLEEFKITAVPPQAGTGKATQAISKFNQFVIQSN